MHSKAWHPPKGVPCSWTCGKQLAKLTSLRAHARTTRCIRETDVSDLAKRNNILEFQYDTRPNVFPLQRNNASLDQMDLLFELVSGGKEEPVVTDLSQDKASQNFVCRLCEGVFRSSAALNQHLLGNPYHLKRFIHVCPKASCKVKTRYLKDLYKHVEDGDCDVPKLDDWYDSLLHVKSST